MEDLIESRRAETVLPAEGLFQSVTKALLMMISCGGLDGHAVFFNERWLSFRGRSMDQERGFSWTEGVYPEDRHRGSDRHRFVLGDSKGILCGVSIASGRRRVPTRA